MVSFSFVLFELTGKGGKNRRRGKGDGEESKRELEFKEDGALVELFIQLWLPSVFFLITMDVFLDGCVFFSCDSFQFQ